MEILGWIPKANHIALMDGRRHAEHGENIHRLLRSVDVECGTLLRPSHLCIDLVMYNLVTP